MKLIFVCYRFNILYFLLLHLNLFDQTIFLMLEFLLNTKDFIVATVAA